MKTNKHFIFFVFFIFLGFFLSGCSRSNPSYPGYIEGEYTFIASGASGALFQLPVVRGQSVKKGELLYALDPEPEKSQKVVAKANIENLEAQVTFAKVQLERQKNLFAKGATTKSNLDQAQTDFDSKREQLSANQAEFIQASWSLAQKTWSSPIDGIVFDTFYRIGENVPAFRPVVALLASENIKVLFYLPENKLSEVKLGQTISFNCDECKTKTLATISYISPEAEYTPPVIYSKDTRYKLVYLVRADLRKEIALQFHPGQPIDVKMHP